MVMVCEGLLELQTESAYNYVSHDHHGLLNVLIAANRLMFNIVEVILYPCEGMNALCDTNANVTSCSAIVFCCLSVYACPLSIFQLLFSLLLCIHSTRCFSSVAVLFVNISYNWSLVSYCLNILCLCCLLSV